MIKKILRYHIIASLIFINFAFSSPVFGQTNIMTNTTASTVENCHCKTKNYGDNEAACKQYCGDYQVNDFIILVIKVSKIMLGLVGSLALGAFVYGGIFFLISAGNNEMVTKGKNAMIGAIIGLFIVFTSYMIINFVMEKIDYNKAKFNNKGWDSVPVSNQN